MATFLVLESSESFGARNRSGTEKTVPLELSPESHYQRYYYHLVLDTPVLNKVLILPLDFPLLLSRPFVFFHIIPGIMVLINHIHYANYYAGVMDARLSTILDTYSFRTI